jgi:hypothetical protein
VFAIERTGEHGELFFASLHVFGAAPTSRVRLNDARSVLNNLRLMPEDFGLPPIT